MLRLASIWEVLSCLVCIGLEKSTRPLTMVSALSYRTSRICLYCKILISPYFLLVATVRENYLENEFFFRSGKSQGIMWVVREIEKGLGQSGKIREF